MTTEPIDHGSSNSDFIRIVYSSEKSRDSRGMLSDAKKRSTEAFKVSTDQIANGFSEFAERFQKVIAAISDSAGQYQLEEIKISVEIGIEGDIRLLGSGVAGNGSSGIEMTFKRTPG